MMRKEVFYEEIVIFHQWLYTPGDIPFPRNLCLWQDACSFKLRPVVEELTREEFGRWVIFRAKAMAHLNERFLADPECVSVYRRRAQEIVDERAQMGQQAEG